MLAFLVCVEDKVEFSYDPFNRGRDFGPLDLAATVIYCRWQDRPRSPDVGVGPADWVGPADSVRRIRSDGFGPAGGGGGTRGTLFFSRFLTS